MGLSITDQMRTKFPFSKYHKESILKTDIFVSEKFQTNKKIIRSGARNKDVFVPRYVAYFILSTIFYFPATTIGTIFNKRHSSVLHGIAKIRKWGWNGEILKQFYEMYPSTVNKHLIDTYPLTT